MSWTIQKLRRLGPRHKLGYAWVYVRSRLSPLPPRGRFPSAERAVKRPAGLLAIGGEVTADTLLDAYGNGIYPLYYKPPVQWWSNDPRSVIFLENFRIGRRLRTLLRRNLFRISFDCAFEQVVQACANRVQTWITPEVSAAFMELHERGFAHSAEAWTPDGKLVGGLYGLALGKVFITESAFHSVNNASKVAEVVLNCHLYHWDFVLNDMQTMGSLAQSLGCENIPRSQYLDLLAELQTSNPRMGKWSIDGCGDVCENCSNSFKAEIECADARILV